MQRTKTSLTEEVFLFLTFSEFIKCWKSSKRSRLFVDSVNGEAFVNFSVFLGSPGEAHSPFTPQQRYPPPKEKKKKKKSSKKIQRDNERAAKFQAKKRQEEAAAKAASGVPPLATSSPAASTVREASVNFSFSSPAPEDISNGSMEGVSDPQPSPEKLREHQEDESSLSTSHNEDAVREDSTEPSLVLLEDRETAYEETESPGLDFDDDTLKPTMNKDENATIPIHDFDESAYELWIDETDWVKANKYKVKPGVRQHKVQDIHDSESWLFNEFIERQLSRGVSKNELKNLWNSDFTEDQVLFEEYRCLQEKVARSRFDYFWQLCDNPRPRPPHQPLTRAFDNREPCNSPNFDGCICKDEIWSDSEDEDLISCI